MTHALVTANTIEAEGGLPHSARRLDTQDWVLGLRDAPEALQQACGYYKVTDTPRPADTATDTHDRTLTLPAGAPTVTWVKRPKTADELAGDVATVTRADIETQARAAVKANRTYLAAPRAQTAAARINDLENQVAKLTKQVNALTRLLVAPELLTDPVVD